MLRRLPLILADSNTVGKVVFGIIALVFWAVSAISSSLNKQKKDRERRQIELEELARRGMLNRPTGAVPPPPPIPGRMVPPTVPQRPSQRVVVQMPPVPLQQQQRQQSRQQPARQQRRQGKKQQKQRMPVPPLPQRIKAPLVAELEEVTTAPAPALPRGATGSSAAAHPLATLLRKSLRSQIVLNEILQPPVALREPREI